MVLILSRLKIVHILTGRSIMKVFLFVDIGLLLCTRFLWFDFRHSVRLYFVPLLLFYICWPQLQFSFITLYNQITNKTCKHKALLIKLTRQNKIWCNCICVNYREFYQINYEILLMSNCNSHGTRAHQSFWTQQLDSTPYKGRISYLLSLAHRHELWACSCSFRMVMGAGLVGSISADERSKSLTAI